MISNTKFQLGVTMNILREFVCFIVYATATTKKSLKEYIVHPITKVNISLIKEYKRDRPTTNTYMLYYRADKIGVKLS